MDFFPGLPQPLFIDFDMAVGMQGEMIVGEQFRLARPLQADVGFPLRFGIGVAVHCLVTVMQDMLFPVVFHMDVHVLFGVNINFFLARLVLDTKLVEAALAFPAGRGHASEHCARSVPRQFIGRHTVRVVQTPGNQRPVRIALTKGNHDFMPDARYGVASVLRSCPSLCGAYPACGMFIPPAFTIPEKLHLHPAILIRVNFFSGQAGHKGSLFTKQPASSGEQHPAHNGFVREWPPVERNTSCPDPGLHVQAPAAALRNG